MENTDQKKRILITGANGFVGACLVEVALKKGYEVWAGVRASSDCSVLEDMNRGYGIWDRIEHKKEARLKGTRKIAEDRIRFIDLRYNDEQALIQQLTTFREEHGNWHYVIHNAGITKALDKNDFFLVNAEYTRRLLAALAASGCQPEKFLLMSSLSTFGREVEKRPMCFPISQHDDQIPDTTYGKSKLLAEQHVCNQTDFPYVVLRPTGIFGPRDPDYLMQFQSVWKGFDFTIGLLHRQWLSFIYVEDLADIAMLALEHTKAVGKAYHVSDGSVTSDKEFGRLLQLIIGVKWVFRLSIPVWMAYIACLCSEWIGKWKKKPATLNTDKFYILRQRKWTCSTEELQKDLGYKAPYSLFYRLQHTIDWYVDNYWLP